MQDKFFITTAIDYTNDVIHIGHSYQKILADTLARYQRQKGKRVFFLMGTDEHGQKVETAAKKAGKDPKKYVDEIVDEDKRQWSCLNISYDRFIRTTDEDHIKFASDFYLRSKKNGDVYLSSYEGLYCEGCENFITESDLVDGKCPFHPNQKPKKISEKNYFFRLSKYQKFIEDLISDNPDFIQPESKRKEILSFVKEGLKDFSISRQNVKWGIPVPDDPNHTIYVWFDALINYLTYGEQKKCWPADVHVLGKDNQRFHAIYWPAMLKSAGYPIPKTILVHDFISLNGNKISKSLGNVISPSELVEKYGTDGVRYYFLRYGPLTNDVDINLKKVTETYNADLANGLGNLVSRIFKLCQNAGYKSSSKEKPVVFKDTAGFLNAFLVNKALERIWNRVDKLNGYINECKPWEKEGDELKIILDKLVREIRNIATNLQPFMPQTADLITKQFEKSDDKTLPILFPRIK